MLPRFHKLSRLKRRVVIVTLIALVVAGVVGWQVGGDRVLRRYQVWKQQKALARAKDFIAQNDPASAKLELDIAVSAVPGSPEALRVAADLLHLVGSSRELSFRRHIADQNPQSVPDRLELISVALRLRDFNAARETLATFTPAEVEKPEVLRAFLGYALGTNDRPMADGLFARLAAFGPPDDDMRAAHAMLLRQHPNREKAAAARKELEALAQNPKFSLTVNRAFFNEALATKDFPAAKRYAALITSDKASTLGDRLNEATVWLLVDRQPFEQVFARLAPTAAATGPDAAEFVRWLLVQGKSAEAERWFATLPNAIASTPEGMSVRMDLAVVKQDWDLFGELLEQGAWGAIPPEAARLAMAAQLVGARKPALQKQIWDEAMVAARGSVSAHRVLLRIATAWRWEDEAESVLWAIVRIDPSQVWAHSHLVRVFRQRGDAKKMLEVMTLLKNNAPTSRTYLHDWALLSLLVLPTSQWDAPKVTAQEVHLADPTNPSYAATYALALTIAGRTDEARGVIEKLSATDRENPLRAPYVAFVYGHSRRQADFEKYAALSAKSGLLNEERRLIENAREAMIRPVVRPAAPAVKPAAKSPAKS